jgi:hypothetical protein
LTFFLTTSLIFKKKSVSLALALETLFYFLTLIILKLNI